MAFNPFGNFTDPNTSFFEDIDFTHLMEEGLLWKGLSPYVAIFGDFTLGILLGAIGLVLYAWKENVYLLIGYLMAVVVVTKVILPTGWADFLIIILGIAITGLLFHVFVRSHGAKERAEGGRK